MAYAIRKSPAYSFLILLLIIPTQLFAEHLPFSFRNNKVRVLADRSTSGSKTAIVIRVKAPDSTGFTVLNAQHPSRLVVDFRGARTTRSKSFNFHDSDVLQSIRCGVHPGFLRVVVSFKTEKSPPYSFKRDGSWFVLTIDELSAEVGTTPAPIRSRKTSASGAAASLLDDITFNLQGWNKLNQDTGKDSETEQTLTNHLEVRPELELETSRSFKTVVSAEANIFSELETQSDTVSEVRLFEAYASYGSPSYSLTVGNQIVTWGKADEISPLNVVNPEDLRDGFVRDRAERKLPVPMVNLELLGDMHRLQLLYLPYFQRSRVDLSGTEWALFGGEDHQSAFVTDENQNEEFGARYSMTFSEFDLAFSYLSSYNDLPAFAGVRQGGGQPLPAGLSRGDLVALADAQGQSIELLYPKQNLYGIEFETVYESLGIRGDIAYKDSENYVTDLFDRVDKRTIQWTLGVDWLSADDLYVNMQYSQTHILDYEEGILFAEELQHGIYGELSKELWNNQLKAGLKSLAGFPLQQFYYNPYLLFTRWDGLTFELGANLISGESAAPLGFYNNNDQVYLLTRFYF